MTKLTDAQWRVLEALWDMEGAQLGELTDALYPETRWSRNTVHTYLTRMMEKGLVRAEGQSPRRYFALVTRDACADRQRRELLDRVYRGSAAGLVMSFVKDGSLTAGEREELRRLLDEMEV